MNFTFVCYARSDSSFVVGLADQLRKQGVDLWLDQWNIPYGADWDREIERAVSQCQVFLVVLSPAAAESGEVRGELRAALDEGKHIVPVIYQPCQVPRQLRLLQQIDVSETTDLEATATQVAVALARAREAPATADLLPTRRQPPALDARLQRTRYVNYILMHPERSPVPCDIPSHSWVNTEPGLIGVGARPEDVGLQPDDYPGSHPPHLPDSELLVDLTLLPYGSTAIVSRIELEVVQSWDILENAIAGEFRPVLDPICDSVVIGRRPQRYPLFTDKVLALKPGEVDLLRVDVRVADDEGPCILAMRFQITFVSGGREEAVQTGEVYLAKSCNGPTLRIPFSKRPELTAARLTPPPRSSPLERDDLWSDPRYKVYLLEFNTCDEPPPTNDLKHLVSRYRQVVMGGRRSELQRNGFERAPWADLTNTSFEPVFVPVNPTDGLGYESTSIAGTIVYERCNTPAYHCLLKTCARLASDSESDCHAATEFLVSQLMRAGEPAIRRWIQRTVGATSYGLDVAGVVDTMTLLSLFCNHRAYDALVQFLSVDHPLVLHRASQIFSAVRYRKAAEPLLRVLSRPANYATERALAALRLNGEPRFVETIIEVCDGVRVMEGNMDLAAAVVLSLDRERASTFARTHSNAPDPSKRTLAYEILLAMEKGLIFDDEFIES